MNGHWNLLGIIKVLMFQEKTLKSISHLLNEL
jgi:hypothetical protein